MENFALDNSTYIANNISLTSNKNPTKSNNKKQSNLNDIIN